MKLPFEKVFAGSIAMAVAAGLVGFMVQAGNGGAVAPAAAREQAVSLPAAAGEAAFTDTASRASVVFAGGCFWGVQGVFQHVRGVNNAVSGYIGGDAASARYERVSAGHTGHAEAVRVDYDPRQVSYGQLLQVFFSVVHDPTQRDRQGPDRGRQYRSAIFADDARQQAANRAYIKQIAPYFKAPLATELSGGMRFHAAEDYHQNYMTDNPQAAYIRYYDAPKLDAFRRQFPALYRSEPRRAATR